MKYLPGKIRTRLRRILGRKTQLEILVDRGLQVGSNFHMTRDCIIDDSHCWHIQIGDDVTFAPRVHILAHDASTKMHLGYTKIRNVKIGNKVFVGAGAIILPGVHIGNNVIIGAGSVVTKDLNDNSVYAGNPATFMMNIENYLSDQRKQMNESNRFGEEYTLRKNIDSDKKSLMKDVVEKYKTGFVE